MISAMLRAAALVAAIGIGTSPAMAQLPAPSARDSVVIQSCVKSKPEAQESCIGIVADPCLDGKDAQSTAGQNACFSRETAVWDDILNETFRRLRDKLNDSQRNKLRDMQRAWIASRDASCAFYWDYYQGTMASPMSASCANKETARRALFLLEFLQDAEGGQ